MIIVGAGIAGLYTAYKLSQAKINVALFDSRKDILNVRFNTLGSFMDLNRHGFNEKVIYSEITKATIYSKHFNVSSNGKAYILNKQEIHRQIYDKIDRNYVKLFNANTVQEVILNDSNIDGVIDENGTHIFAKLIVDASGSVGFITKKIGLQDKKINFAEGVEYNSKYLGDPSETHFFIGQEFMGGYAWIFPVGNNRAIVGFGTFNESAKQNIKQKLDKLFELKLLKKLIIKDNEEIMGGNIPITSFKEKLVLNNLVCVGDSISQVNPIPR